MPPVEVPRKGFLQNYSFIFPVRTLLHLYSFLLSQLVPFFPPVWLLLCLRQAFYGGSVGSTTKPKTWYTLRSINSVLSKRFPTRTRNSHARSSPDRSHTDLPSRRDWAYTSQRVGTTDLPRLKTLTTTYSRFSSQLLSATLLVAQEAQREDDKLSIRPGSGEFSSCLHTEPTLPSTCAEQRSSHLAPSLSGTYMRRAAFSPHLLPVPATLFFSPGRGPGRFPGRGCSSGLDCSRGHNELVYKTTQKIAV